MEVNSIDDIWWLVMLVAALLFFSILGCVIWCCVKHCREAPAPTSRDTLSSKASPKQNDTARILASEQIPPYKIKTQGPKHQFAHRAVDMDIDSVSTRGSEPHDHVVWHMYQGNSGSARQSGVYSVPMTPSGNYPGQY